MSPSEQEKSSQAFRERLTAYLDDRMPPAEAREFLAWLERHPAAWKEAEESRRVWAILSAYRDEAVPDGFAERVLARVGAAGGAATADSHEMPPNADVRPMLRVLAGGRARAVAVAAGLVVAVGAGVMWGRHAGRGDSNSMASNPTVAAINAVPAGLLDQLDERGVAQIASLSDEDFDAILFADPQDLTPADGSKLRGG
jgi:anti-sigma factor RsiW